MSLIESCIPTFSLRDEVPVDPEKYKADDVRVQEASGIRWKLSLAQAPNVVEGYTGFQLDCLHPPDQLIDWTIRVNMDARVFHPTERGVVLIENTYTNVHFNRRTAQLIFLFPGGPIGRFPSSGGEEDVQFGVEASIRLHEATGVAPPRDPALFDDVGQEDVTSLHPRSDAVLVLNDTHRFHVSRALLSLHSTYFRTMFFDARYSDGGVEKREMSLMLDIAPVIFKELLYLIYNQPNLTINNAWPLAQLADYFNLPKVRQIIETQMLVSPLTLHQRLMFADHFVGYDRLMISIVSQLGTEFEMQKHGVRLWQLEKASTRSAIVSFMRYELERQQAAHLRHTALGRERIAAFEGGAPPP